MIFFVTGGASCGKSAFAEGLCMALGGDKVYLAAMKPFGVEGAARVRKHRAQRAGKGFRTVECFDGLSPIIASGELKGATVLLECLGNVVANEMFSMVDADESAGSNDALENDVTVEAMIDVFYRVESEISSIAQQCSHLVVIGNEVGSDGICHTEEMQRYQRLLGALACKIAAKGQFVFECVAGIPQILKADDMPSLGGVVARFVGQACGKGVS